MKVFEQFVVDVSPMPPSIADQPLADEEFAPRKKNLRPARRGNGRPESKQVLVELDSLSLEDIAGLPQSLASEMIDPYEMMDPYDLIEDD